MNRIPAARVGIVLAVAAAAVAVGCSSSTTPPAGNQNPGDDASDDGAAAASSTGRLGQRRPRLGHRGERCACRRSSSTSTSAGAGDLPAGSAGVAAYCSSTCGRLAQCLDAGGGDASTCNCTPGSLVLYRSDYVAALGACVTNATCSNLLSADAAAPDAGEAGCTIAALEQITPTAAVTAFCSQVGLSNCADDAISACPDTIKVYSDVTVNQLAACVAAPSCSTHLNCITSALTPP